MKNGIDPQVLYDAIKDGWAGSTVLNVAAPGIIEQNYTPGGTIDILFKDIGYALSLASRSGYARTGGPGCSRSATLRIREALRGSRTP